jgi:hypothetical protein
VVPLAAMTQQAVKVHRCLVQRRQFRLAPDSTWEVEVNALRATVAPPALLGKNMVWCDSGHRRTLASIRLTLGM